jgi:PAS domain S-box-containing protein
MVLRPFGLGRAALVRLVVDAARPAADQTEGRPRQKEGLIPFTSSPPARDARATFREGTDDTFPGAGPSWREGPRPVNAICQNRIPRTTIKLASRGASAAPERPPGAANKGDMTRSQGETTRKREPASAPGQRRLQAQSLELLAKSERIRESEAELRGILNATKESIWQFTPEGVILMGNAVALSRFGRTAEEVIGRNFAEFVPPDLAASRQAKLREVAETRRALEFEDERAGISFRHSFYPVFDAAGNVSSIACFSRDITGRKKAEEALRRSEAMANALIQHAPTGIYEFDYRGPKFLRVNDVMCRILGYSREEFFSMSPAELLDEEGRRVFGDRIRRQLAGEPMQDVVEYRVRKKDGQMIDAVLNISVAPTAEGPHRVMVIAHDITERKRMEAALVKARTEADGRARELAIVLEAMPVGVVMTRDPEGLHISGNRAAHQLLRVPPEESNISKSAPDPEGLRSYRPVRNGLEVPPRDLPVQRAARGEEVRDWDCDLVFKDGDVRHVVINAAPLQREGEPFRGAIAAFIDVTSRRLEAEARKRDRERYEILSATAARLLESEDPQAVVDELCRRIMGHLDCQVYFNFLVDREAGKLRLNACGGIPEPDAERLRWLDFGAAVCGYVAEQGVRVVAEDITAHPDPRTDLVAGYGVRAYACHPLMSRGEVLGTLSFGSKTRTRFSGDDLSMMRTVADQVAVAIERMRDQQALRDRGAELQRLTMALESRVQERTAELAAANESLKAEAAERLRLLAAVEQADEGVVIMDAEGRIRHVNAAFTRLSGLGRDELLTMSYGQLLAPGPDGKDSWSSVKISIERGETWRGHVSRVAGEGGTLELDVTLSPVQDAAGRIINYLAVERDVTREIRLQQHLRQSQKLEALGTLAGGIAHDFNNILNPIFISTELLLLDDTLDPSDRRHLEITLKAAERGRDLVKQIIAFSRQKEKERKQIKAGPVVTEAVKFLRASLPSTIEIRSDIRDETGTILGDQAQIHQLVMNLCSNAAYAMRERGGVLSVGLSDVDVDERLAAQVPALKPGPYLRLTVTDTGTGMTPQVKERAFDPFFTTKKAGEGSGMGLAVVAGIVRDSGGAVSLASAPDHGSTFEIYLPRVAGEGQAAKNSPEGLPGGAERILLVDDEEVQVRSIKNMLGRLGYEVVGLADGLEALRLFKSDPRSFDLLITDQTMPQLTGLRLSKEVLGLRPDLPIILCTGYSETVDAAEARTLGIREFLMKPYSIHEMAEMIRRALTGYDGPTPERQNGG